MASNSKNIAELLNGDTTITATDLSYPLTGFSSTGIDDNADATAITIDSSENVMVGTANGSVANNSSGNVGIKFDGAQGQIQVTNVSDAQLYLNRQGTDGTIAEFRKDGSGVGDIGSDNGRLYIQSSGGGNLAGIGFSRTAVAVEPRKNNAFSSSEVDVGSPTYKFRDAYLSGGAYLGGTAAANKLDDYEEGSWTPLAKGTSTNPSVAPTLIGRYTKIGNQVNIYLKFDAVSFAGAAGGVYFDGLPFSASGATVHGIGSIMQYNVCTFNDSPCLYVSGSAVYIYHNVSGGTWDNSQHTGSSAVYMNACVTYTTNS
jgi:hypothetical protein